MSEAREPAGIRLRAARERRGMTVAKVADDIHLDVWVVEAIEAGDYARIGPAVYAKGHMKRYAELVGVPADDIVAGYDPDGVPQPVVNPGSGVFMRTSEPAAVRFPWWQMLGFAVAAAVVAAVVWWHPWHPRAQVAPSMATPAGAPTAAAPAAAPSDQAASASDSGGRAVSTATVATPPVSTASAGPADASDGLGRTRIRLSFSGDTSIDVHDAAGRRVFAGTGRSHSVKSLTGAGPLRIYLKPASGVQLEINNRAVGIGPQFVVGDEARFEAGADGVLRRDSHPRG